MRGVTMKACSPADDTLLHPRPHLRQRFVRAHLGADRLLAGRQLVQDRDVEVAIERSARASAGSGVAVVSSRCGIEALLAERRALAHAEAMLLVDDRETEPLERDGLLHQRVRPDDHLDLARRESGEDLLRARTGDARGEKRVPRPAACEQRRERPVVLLRQKLGRRHERGLRARGDRDARRERGDDGLSRPDIALEQARHRHRPREVRADLSRTPRSWSAVSVNGSAAIQRVDRRVVGAQRQSLRLFRPARAPLAERELQHEELVERETPPRA